MRNMKPLNALWIGLLCGCSSCGGATTSSDIVVSEVTTEEATAPTEDPRDPAEPQAALPPPTDEQRELFAQATNAFAVDSWGQLRSTPGNLAVSPASIEVALAMTYGGAAGETQAAMARTLHVEGEPAAFHEAAGRQLGSWNDPEREIYELRVANRLFGERTYALRDPFLELTRQTYGAPMELVDFRGDAEGVRGHINDYVSGFTNERIVDLLPSGALDSDTRLVLTNAIYMLAKWSVPFDPNMTHPAPFHVGGASATENVDMMNRRGSYGYADLDGVNVLELPYQGDDLSMVIVLPDATDGVAAVEQGLSVAGIAAWIAALSPTEVQLALPKFRVEPEESIELKPTLTALGMGIAFDSENADFSGMANPPDPRERLHISHVFHKAFVAVDEEGTEAAAATAVVMGRGAGMPQPAPEFRADRPFLFLIRDVHSGAILFLGRVVDPRS